eukprot:scaffold13046_cov38-Prasinocladus_malaysianus.AAC.1
MARLQFLTVTDPVVPSPTMASGTVSSNEAVESSRPSPSSAPTKARCPGPFAVLTRQPTEAVYVRFFTGEK